MITCLATERVGDGVNVLEVCEGGVERREVADLPRLLERQDTVKWVDIPVCDKVAVEVLEGVFRFHEVAVHDCVGRNHVSKLHVYPDHAFTVLHAPHVGQRGHVHYVELDQFIGPNYLVTVHGPLNAAVAPEIALLDTAAVLRRIEEEKLQIHSPFQLSHWITTTMIRREADLVASLAQESGRLEQRVMLNEEELEDPEALLEKLFRAWYELLAVRTIATHSGVTFGRMSRLIRFLPESELLLLADIEDRFEVLQTMADGQREFLYGVIDFYQTRSSTHMTIAAE